MRNTNLSNCKLDYSIHVGCYHGAGLHYYDIGHQSWKSKIEAIACVASGATLSPLGTNFIVKLASEAKI